MENLVCYKQLPVWNKETLPAAFQQKHNTKAGTWAKLTIFKGRLKFYELDEAGNTLEEHVFDANNPPPFVEPQAWHRVEADSDDLECQLAFYCLPKDYYEKKYSLSSVHSEVLELTQHIQSGNVLDLGCGRGRNALYMGMLGFDVTALDIHAESIRSLNEIIQKENIKNIHANVYDINRANVDGSYDAIVSTVVMMFLQREQIPAIIANMQSHTKPGGYNLIVCAMDTKDRPCPMPFSFTFKENELKNYYKEWGIIKYNENMGKLHKTDINGNPIELRFATLLAKKQ